MSDDILRKSPGEGDLELAVRQRILNRTNRRIQMLDVAQDGNCVVVRGYTNSFHLKQLAIQAVLDVVSANQDRELKMDIHITVFFPVAKDEFA